MVNLEGKKILVTGGLGFIGLNFVRLVIDLYPSVDITIIDKMGQGYYPKYKKYLNDKVTLFVEDISKKVIKLNSGRSDELILKDDIDYIFHFAAESHVDRSISNPEFFIKNNIFSTTNVLNFLREISEKRSVKMVNISTDEVYGSLGESGHFYESSNIDPNSPYSASKASSDLIVNSYVETYGLDVITTRCCNNYGPFQNSEKFIPKIINNILEKMNIPIYGSGLNVREWIFVDDHNKSILDILSQDTDERVFNISSGVEMNNIQIVEKIIEIMDPDGVDFSITTGKGISFVNDRMGHDFRYSVRSNNYERSFKLLNFDEGLKFTINHFKEELC